MASSTTMPSSSGTRYSRKSPPEASPRKTCITASATFPPSGFDRRGGLGLEQRTKLVGHLGQGTLGHANLVPFHRRGAVHGTEIGVQIRIVDPRVRAAALFPLERAPRHNLADQEHVPEI